jgi:glycosyltransferase involved in cell wall biosynthesis
VTSASSAPSVSVVLSTFDGGRFLRAQLSSLLAQELRPAELVVCDDGSSDDTWDILAAFAAMAPFQVRLHRNAMRMGSRRSFEKGIRLARSEVIALCDQDDVWRADKLAVTVQALELSGAPLAFCDAALVGRCEEPLGFGLWEAIGFSERMFPALADGSAALRLLRQNVVTGCASAFWTRYRALLVPFSPRWIHDYWIAVVLAIVGNLRPIPAPLLSYRQHGANQIGVDLEALRQRRVSPWRGANQDGSPFHESLTPDALADLRLHLSALLEAPGAARLDDAARARATRLVQRLSDAVPAHSTRT